MSTLEIQHISANGKIAQWRKKARNSHIHFHVTQKCLLTVSAFSMDQFLQPNLKRKACATVLSSFKQDQLRHVLYVSLWFFSFFFPHTKPVSSLRTTIFFFSHAFIFEQKMPFHAHVRFLSARQLCRHRTLEWSSMERKHRPLWHLCFLCVMPSSR